MNTQKQIVGFIEEKIKRLGINKKELLVEVESLLDDLNDYPSDNKNQIQYFTKVKKTLSAAFVLSIRRNQNK